MTVRMFDYKFKVGYRPGKTNISNYTSRHPLPLEQSGKRELGTTNDVRHYVNFVSENDIPKAISKEEIIVSTGNDRELQKLIKCVEEKSIDHKDEDLRKYSNVFNELAVVDGLVLRGERIVVPQTLRGAALKIAHEGHQGIVRTKQLLRAHVWFLGTDTMVEKHVGKCLACQSTTPCHTREPLQMTDLPRGPWKKVSVDFAGPLRNKDMALVFWDQYARYPVVEFTSSTFADYVIPLFTRVFNTYGIPEEIKSGSDTERSLLGGLKLMVTWSVSCKPSRRVREFLNLKEKLFGRECKERLAAIAPRPTQRQRKALTCSCSAESYGGSYRKGSYP